MEQSLEKPILETINDIFAKKAVNPNEYSPLALAFIGDSIFDVVIKSVVVEKANCQVNKLQNKTSKIVRATSQAIIADALKDELTEDERAVYKRARNSKQHSTKNSALGDYHKATGFEAVMGYLYLKNEEDRMLTLLKKAFDMINEDNKTI